ncbi:MAG: PrsW family glutamic-type intramembrane protease [Spirochaetes bacterium]|nr:PrsW family glutamic-type intramembrane protease [Spirochaetota bacterium]
MIADIAKLVGLAALPAVVLLAWFNRMDRKRPEPIGMIGRSVLFGFVAVIPAVILEIVLEQFNPGGLPGAVFSAFVVAAFVEEGVKFLFVRFFIWKIREFDEVMDGIVYTICVSLGFAFVENVFYGLNDARVLYLRAFTAVPLHAVASGVMGYCIGKAKITGMKNPGAFERRGLLWAVIIHGFYDVFLFAHPLLWPFSILTLASGALALYCCVQAAKKLDAGRVYPPKAADALPAGEPGSPGDMAVAEKAWSPIEVGTEGAGGAAVARRPEDLG